MSLAIAFKSPEGIVLAADSRVTINTQIPQSENQTLIVSSTFDNATKLLKVNGQEFVGAVTYGLGGLGQNPPRTAASFMPEFEESLRQSKVGRLSVEEFSKRLSAFFVKQWQDLMPPDVPEEEQLNFVVGGFDNEDSIHGRLFEFSIPGAAEPTEQHPSTTFGIRWGGQHEFVGRLVNGYDPGLLQLLQDRFNLEPTEVEPILRATFSAQIPYSFLPLQDCVDLSVFFIKTTIGLQQRIIGIRGVGGAIDVATITRTEGLRIVQEKKITAGESQ